VRFVNREPDSGTRFLFDQLLTEQHVDSSRIDGYETGEFTHAAVAAYVASGMADAGFGIETPAHRFGLDFLPLVKERYFFLVRADQAESATVAQALAIMRSVEFRRTVQKLPGYDATHCGRMLDLDTAFPQLAGR
jgi:molybdate-binding protein